MGGGGAWVQSPDEREASAAAEGLLHRGQEHAQTRYPGPVGPSGRAARTKAPAEEGAGAQAAREAAQGAATGAGKRRGRGVKGGPAAAHRLLLNRKRGCRPSGG